MKTRSLLAVYTELRFHCFIISQMKCRTEKHTPPLFQKMWTDSKLIAPNKLRTQDNTVRFDYDQETRRRH